MTDITLLQAVNQALAYALAHDPDVLVFGEDVGVNGGVFRATDNLAKRFGENRVFDTPLAESLIAGMALGLAAQGLKPVAEIQFLGFSYPAFDQIINHIGRLRNRTRGRLSAPLVIRAPYGGGIRAPEHHSESTEALYAHIPGIKVVIPSSPARAYGLLLAAIADPDPVLFFEPKRVYRLVKQSVEDNGQPLPLERCFLTREGDDITLISWGAMMNETQLAATELSALGIEADVIDVATLKPLDSETILQSIEKTGRCVIVQEAPKSGGFASEIAAIIAEQALLFLKAPIQRVSGYDTVMPYFQLENAYLPSVKCIVNAARHSMEYP
jgi:2-oxoisovalerate dehydrogenase E1 component beta subunit